MSVLSGSQLNVTARGGGGDGGGGGKGGDGGGGGEGGGGGKGSEHTPSSAPPGVPPTH